MKFPVRTITLTAAALAVWSAPCLSAPEPLSATIQTTEGQPIALYIISATPDQITYSLDPSGAGPRVMLRSLISDIAISPPDGWGPVQAKFDAGLYEEVVEPLAEYARDYAGLRAIRDSVGSLAKLYHLITLRAVGQFDLLGRELAALPEAPLVLNDELQQELDFLTGWAHYGNERWDLLGAFLSTFEDTTVPDEVSLRPFRQVGLARVAELCFLRARLREHQGQTHAAINDYYAAMTINLGSPEWLRRKVVLSALKLTDQILNEQEQHPVARFDAHALALLADRSFGNGDLPAALRTHLERPDGLPTPPGQVVSRRPEGEDDDEDDEDADDEAGMEAAEPAAE